MSPRSYLLDDATAAYVVAHAEPADEVHQWLVEQTAALGPVAGMQIGADQGVLLTILARLADASFAVEVGTFTGTSALYIARGLAPHGRLICCDVSEEWTAIARQGWARAGVDDRIELAIGPAIDTLRSMPDDPIIDFAFVDADKTGYPEYYEELVPRLRPGGVLLADNTLRGGSIVDSTATDESVEAIRRYNDRAVEDERVTTVLLPLADGITMSQKR